MADYIPLTSEERVLRNAVLADEEKVELADYYDEANRRIYYAVESDNIDGHNKLTYQKWIEYVNPRDIGDSRIKMTYEDLIEEEE